MTYYGYDSVDLKSMIGKTLVAWERQGDEELHFRTSEGEHLVMYHSQDCCESVYIESIVGDLSDLLGSPLLNAEEVSFDGGKKGEWDDSYSWTFYKFATIKGYVDIRWYGTSNGYYSEGVDLVSVNANDEEN